MKKLKKYAAALVVMAAAIGMTGCNREVPQETPQDPSHVHTYSEKWSKNEDYHWHAATCGHSSEESDRAPHSFSEWIVMEEATEEKTGYRERDCLVCFYSDRDVIPMKEHVPVITTETTYDTDGHKIVTKYSDSNVLQEIHYYKDSDDIHYIYEYDISSGKWVKYTLFDRAGTEIYQYQAADGNFIASVSIYYSDNNKLNFIQECDIHTSNLAKLTSFNSDGLLDSICEYNSLSGWKMVKITEYNTNGSVLYQYQAADGNYIITSYNSDKSIFYIEEHIFPSEKLVKKTYYNSDASVKFYDTYEYRETDGQNWKYTRYNSDNSVLIQYQAVDNNYIREVSVKSDGIVDYIEEYHHKNTDKWIKDTYYNSDGSVKYYAIYEYDITNDKPIKYSLYNSKDTVYFQYQVAEGNYIKYVSTLSDGSINYIEEYKIIPNNFFGRFIKFTKYKSDGTELIQYEAAEGNYIYYVSKSSDGSVVYISEYSIADGKEVKRTYYNQDGSIKTN